MESLIETIVPRKQGEFSTINVSSFLILFMFLEFLVIQIFIFFLFRVDIHDAYCIANSKFLANIFKLTVIKSFRKITLNLIFPFYFHLKV